MADRDIPEMVEARGVARVADWVAAQLALVEEASLSPVPAAEVVRLGDDQVVIHAPRGRSFCLTVTELTEVEHG